MGVDNLEQIQILNQLFSGKELKLSEKLLSLEGEVVSLVGSLESQKTAFNTVQAELTTKQEREQELESQVERISIELKTQTHLAEKRLFRLEEREKELLLQLNIVKNETQKYLLLLTEKEKEFLKKEYSLRDLLNQMDINHRESSKNHLLTLVEREKEFRIELKQVLDEKHVLAENFSHKLEQVLEEKHSLSENFSHKLVKREKEFRIELKQVLDEKHVLAENFSHKLEQVLEEKHSVELKNSDLTHLLNVAQQLESQLRNELANHQQMLINVVTELENLKRSFTYRLTAPLRGIYEIFIPSKAIMGIKKLPLSSFENVIPSLLQPIQEIPMPSTTPIVAVSSLDELLAYHDADFVHCAYITLLGRIPDPEGMRYYLGRLRAGRAKIAILKQMASSSEGKKYDWQVAGLKQAFTQYRWETMPIIGMLFPKNGDIQLQVNRLESQIAIQTSNISQQFKQIEAELGLIKNIALTIVSKTDQQSNIDKASESLSVEDLLVIAGEIK